ncbi:MAG TPA: O-antigen ligase family protein, partial [Thermomicrobiales bacterium]|nr:O-antigen ligase family protein [Thermomicrobiales bacterium]
FALMMYSRASEVLTTSLGIPSIAPLFTIWLLTGIVMHYGLGGVFHARPTGWQALAVYGLVLLASALVAADAWRSTYRVVEYTRELVYIALIVTCVRQLSDLRIVWRALLIGGTIPALITIYQTISGSTNWFLGFGRYSAQIVVPGEIVEVPRPAGMVGDPNMYAMALIALIPLAFLGARWEKHWLARTLWLLSAVALMLASIMTYSRGGYVSLAVVIACLAVTGFIKFRSLLMVGLIVLVLMPVLPDSYTSRISSLTSIPMSLVSDEPPKPGEATDSSVDGRVAEMMAGLHMFMDHPILGVGTNNYQVHFQEYARPLGINRRADRAAHSLYVEIAAETGIVGLLSFGALVVTLFVSLRRVWTTNNKGNELHDLALIVAISLISLLVSCIFLHFAYPRFFMVFAGLAMAVASVQNWRERPASRLRFARLQPSQRLLTPAQHGRAVVWGGAGAIGSVALVAAIMMTMVVKPGGLTLLPEDKAAAIGPQIAGAPAPGNDGTSQSVPPVAGQTPTAGNVEPTAVPPTKTPAPEPTPEVAIATQADLLRAALAPVGTRPDCRYDADAKHNICDHFLEFYKANGGEAAFGRPLSEQYIIAGTLVQYYERARFEWHAGENGQADSVLLSRLGAQQRLRTTGHEIDPTALPEEDEGCIYEDVTGHNVCGEFAFYWITNGGASLLGYPISERTIANGVSTQYFERARLEIHLSAAGTPEVVAANLGTEEVQRILTEAGADDGTGPGD